MLVMLLVVIVPLSEDMVQLHLEYYTHFWASESYYLKKVQRRATTVMWELRVLILFVEERLKAQFAKLR